MTDFMGYVRPDGSVGIRNHILIMSATVYANKLCERVADVIRGAIAITHPLGRCQVLPDLRMTRRFLAGTARNPNVGGVVIVDHFREEGMTAYDLCATLASPWL
jgi:altronate dehydratase large subunit